MKYDKKRLIALSKKVISEDKITPFDVEYLLNFEHLSKDNIATKLLKQAAVPLSLLFGFLFTVFPNYFSEVVAHLPSWTNLSPSLLIGVDYLWDLIGEPIKKENIIYHIPNIILYSFGVVGVKKLFDALDKRTWLDNVLAAKQKLKANITEGNLNLSFHKGHSILFVGKGDFIGMQFVLNHKIDTSVTISQIKPAYTSFWNYYNPETTYQDLKIVLEKADASSCGEYVFFPVKDDQIFLPSSAAYDLSPHKLDILCQNIRTIEKEHKWKTKRIIIVGDKYHKSFVKSEDLRGTIKNTEDTISLASISKKYKNVTLLDPSDIVLQRIIEIGNGRKIAFRATREGIAEYKDRFFERLEKLGYKQKKNKKGVLTIGYDLFEDQTEQQTLARTIDDYYPVVLSKNVRDALIRNGYKTSEFLYVPELVLSTLTKKASEQ